MLEPIKNAYYQTLGNSLSGIQELQARMGFIPDRETAYATQMGSNPFSLRSYKYAGKNTSVVMPPLATKPGKTGYETISNYLDARDIQKPGSNRILIRTHTHPTKLNTPYGNSDIENLMKPPSVPDLLNAASVYTVPQNSNLKYNRNKIYTKENGKNVRYIFDVSDKVKEKMKKGGNSALVKYAITEYLSQIPKEVEASYRGLFDALRGKGNYFDLSTDYINQLTLNKYRKMGYPIIRQEF